MWNAARQVGADDLVPLRRLDLEERPDLRLAGVVDEAVDAAEPLDDAPRPAPRPAARRHVGGEALGLAAGGPDPRERRLRRGLGRWW